MRFFPDNIWSLTTAVVSMLVASTNVNLANAGGDPNVKDKKIEKSDSNIKQHNHSKVYKTNKKEIKKSKTNQSNSNSKNSDSGVETAGICGS